MIFINNLFCSARKMQVHAANRVKICVISIQFGYQIMQLSFRLASISNYLHKYI